jgi:hypothetical protein
MSDIGFNRVQIPNGTYNLIDTEGFHYAAFGGLGIVKSTDENDPEKPLRVAAAKNYAADMPPELHKSHFVGLGMTYDGYIAAAAHGALLLVDRDLNLKGIP